MSYTLEVKKDRKIHYSCNNTSWHLMWGEIKEAVSDEHKPAIEKMQGSRHVRWQSCRKIAAALETIPNGAGIFSAPCTIADLLVVFRAAAEMKSSVFTW